MDGVAMAQSLGNTMGACGDVRLCHDGHDTPPRRGARPGPQRLIESMASFVAFDGLRTPPA
jgi:hypothetical protein